MAKSIRALSGAAKDAYIKRMLASEDMHDAETRARLTARMQDEIALITLRQTPRRSAKRKAPGASLSTDEVVEDLASTLIDATSDDAGEATEATAPAFDPYSPNVIVVIRTRGRQAVLDELHLIEDVDSLRLLAREQQLGIATELETAADIRLAIVAAAERRIANRRAAAS